MTEPISPEPPSDIGRTLLTQSWLDLALLHWEIDPDLVSGLLPAGTSPDVLDGRTYVGLIAFRMHRVGWLGLPGVPYFGTFPETNVRLYSVDGHGRRGVVFRSLDASRLLPVVIARAGFRLPYLWARMSIRREGAVLNYECRRRWPGPRGARSALSIRIGERIEEPSELEHFVTARWGLHNDWFGRPLYLPNAHPRWPLYRADVLNCDDELVRAAGLPAPTAAPVSVLYSPGVQVRFGPPARDPATRSTPSAGS
ncbi:DUF2071 domain-containing protein [Actinospica sp.]|jgi:hypothetical protein|uniref:YqjF family protein n=1 Tax=Actinospica sp. TaxID=1872142 RepID=UPI002BCA8877|nr:DUF2071 domain-containing protein [Actinospica sp.]HWG23955.1 DUF2071 domain-containing protein [Actinospica sp.]